ncbi:universal stress protein [Pseudonocardia sp. TRM90224]|uniref:universal stress protein n=1 Tax=Pseudonocardia sp. TRM90224 TaxID=2812678 RepID=UPI001E45B858|nr:universal stress protein [Pseudonocardia sp. TRM90224]
MASGRAALASRPVTTSATSSRLVVIGRMETPVPPWAHDWCADVGYALIKRSAPAGAALEIGPEGGDEWSRLAGDVEAMSAAGSAVLISRGTWRRGGRQQVVAAVRDLPGDEAVLVDAAACATAMDASLLLVHGVPLSFGPRSIGLDAAVDRGLAVLDEGQAFLAARSVESSTQLLRVRPHELVNEQLDADLLVVGGASRRLSAQLGLVALSALQHAPCPVLLAPRTTP